jgi:chromosome segregation protein
MVRIDKIEMQGFKSFAKKTTVLLPSNFTVICGPNGSGKSNVLDGICFVLGRSSAKSLRADRMHEMIFNGGTGKQPSEAAKVAMFFDNNDKTFPLEDGTIMVSRTVNRKGVSIYKLNGRTVTREKVLEVLRAAHITPDGYNIILQGDITEIIEMSPLDRREIIDEVAGIAEFDAKRERAQRELATVEERLKEAAIVLNERSAALEKLESEANSAEGYKKLTAELDKLRASLAKKRLGDAEAAMIQLNKGIETRAASISDFDRKLSTVDSELEKSEAKLKKLGGELIDRSGDIAMAHEIERISSDISRRRDRIEFGQSEIRRMDELISRLEAMQARSLEHSPAVREVLRLGRTGVYGTVANLSKVPAQYQTAIEVCAGPHLWDVVVSDENVAIDCVNHLKRGRIGRATFLPLDKIREREGGHLKKYMKQPGVVGLAIDLIEFDKKYWHAFSFVFGDTLVVDNISTARRIGIGSCRMVTLDGDLIERSGAIIGGFYHSDKKAFVGTDEMAKYAQQKEQLTAELAKLKEEILVLESKLARTTAEETKGSAKLKSDLAERSSLEQTIASLRLQRKEFAEAKVTAEAEVQNLRIKRARLEAELENVKAEFANYAAVKDTYADMSPHEMEGKMGSTIAAINRLGAINQRAPEELEQLKPAYVELKGRVETLTSERERVVGIMSEIEGKRKNTFMTTLTAIIEQFKIVYKDLTGGEGDLKLEEPENIESGLLIEACPPGRKVLNIDAMSGGEKTMTALAFLFAIQRFRPAPFYILDEIDAALDKPNVKKTTDLIKKYSDRAQFIVISHNDSTVAAADCVYGVSMEEGESKLVGIKMPA